MSYLVKTWQEACRRDGGEEQENPRPAAPATETTNFADLSAEKLDNVAEARTSKNTNVQTKWGVKIFRGK